VGESKEKIGEPSISSVHVHLKIFVVMKSLNRKPSQTSAVADGVADCIRRGPLVSVYFTISEDVMMVQDQPNNFLIVIDDTTQSFFV